MYYQCLSEFPPILVISVFSLAWFVVGVLAGDLLSRSRQVKRVRTQAPSRRPGKSNHELYVGNLSYDVGDRELEKAFAKFGKVVSARVIENKFNGKSKGYGFVQMSTQSESDAAMKTMNGQELQGRRLVVNAAKSKARD